MPLITLQNVDLGVGGPLLLADANLTIEPNERVCIVGRNGAGKSTLMKLLGGEIGPDDGVVVSQSGLRVARLAQEVPQGMQGTVFDVVAAGLGSAGADLAEYHHLIHALHTDADVAALSVVQGRIEAAHAWDLDRRVTDVLTRLDLPEDVDFAALSGGMKRRVLLAQALVTQPDLLLLDEPTNHLDIESIAWLEEFLRGLRGSVVFVTHDRRFLRALATRIVEIDRGQVTSWPGDYDNYLRRREERLHAESQANALFDKRLAEEEVWIRQGIKARRTRNEGRVRALEALRRDRSKRREQEGQVRVAVAEASASGKRVIEAKGLRFAFGERVLVDDFSVSILRGDRIGILGPNGIGKTTLIKLLLGEIAPQAGEVRLGTNLEVAYFDQHRATLREDWTALDNVAEGREFIEIGDSRKHALGYLQDFLFTPERARAPITALSGGERNRLLLARLFARPSNLLVMDEPTNDLDVETLELLEERLAEYSGTLLLVSHDRDFIDSVVTSTLAMEGDGRIGEYVGGYSDWLRQRPASMAPIPGRSATLTPTVQASGSAVAPASAAAKRKLGFKQQRELEQLPAQIEALESRIREIGILMQDPAFYRSDAASMATIQRELAAVQEELDGAYGRWEALDAQS